MGVLQHHQLPSQPNSGFWQGAADAHVGRTPARQYIASATSEKVLVGFNLSFAVALAGCAAAIRALLELKSQQVIDVVAVLSTSIH